jgi:hypothetical protein
VKARGKPVHPLAWQDNPAMQPVQAGKWRRRVQRCLRVQAAVAQQSPAEGRVAARRWLEPVANLDPQPAQAQQV